MKVDVKTAQERIDLLESLNWGLELENKELREELESVKAERDLMQRDREFCL